MKICVHSFKMGDVEDPALFAAEPIWQWQQSEQGKWVMEHSLNQPVFYTDVLPDWFGYRITIMAEFSEKDEMYFRLKWL